MNMSIYDYLDVPSFYLFISNQVAQCSVLFILILSFSLSYFISIISGITLALTFFLGVITFNVIWTNTSIDPISILGLSNHSTTCFVQTNNECTVCGDNFCKRQKAPKDNQPWLGLNISRDVDQAIQDLFNKILNEFITSWHSLFTKDESFVLELRRCLRYSASILLRRILQVDIGEVITDQLVTTGLRHVNDYINISDVSTREKITIEEAATKYLGKRLHPAVHTRKSELQYLRSLSDLLLNHLVQSPQLKCLSFRVLIRELLAGWVFLPLTDILCDPYCINSLLLLALSHEPFTQYPDHSEFPVQFLHRFVIPNKDFVNKKSVLHSSLSTILKDQKLLYTFMQFLKREGVVHILQFCLDVEEFSKKILNPELSQREMENLHKEAWDLFSVYFKTASPDSIHFPKHIVQQMEQVVESGPTNIGRLRTNPTLFKAYEIAYALLEETYCPLFYLSDYFFPLLCGERQRAAFAKSGFSPSLQPGSPIKGRIAKKSSDASTVGKLSSKFHKLLQFQAVEGKAYLEDTPLDLAETECTEDLQIETHQETTYRDMSSWRVTIPSVTTKQDSNSKPYPVFNVGVVDVGAKENSGRNSNSKWNVERRYNDFYLLQAKLAEFHGEFEAGTQLPPKTGIFSPRGSEFLENRRQLFEEYIQKLLQKPTLRGSDLLYFFLHSPSEFSSCLSVQDGIGKMIRKSVEPIKLRKERGQHLENFLNVLLASTEGSKKTGKYEWQDVSVEPQRRKRNISQSIFNDNFHDFINKSESLNDVPKETLVLLGPWECILYVMSRLLGASSRVMQATMTLKNILNQASDLVIKRFITKKLESFLVSGRISHLVRLLQDALFNSNYKPGKQGHKLLKDKLMSEVNKMSESVLIRWLLPDFSQGIEKIIDTLQHPILNKHLCYCLLDEVVLVLFPELATSS